MKSYKVAGRRVLVLLVLASLLAVVPTSTTAQAQQDLLFFPQTGHFLGGAFRVFWEQRGGVGVFGYPVTDEYYRAGDSRIVQYFQRARFELVELQGPQPGILLANVGVDYVRARGYYFPPVPNPGRDTASRRFFPETGHTLQGQFKNYWDRNQGATYLGAPISEEVGESFPNGQNKRVQYFERGRLELEPDGQVSRGLLGDALAPCQQKIGRPQNLPPSGPQLEGDATYCDRPDRMPMGRAFPANALPGVRIGVEAINFDRNEEVAAWINLPNNTVRKIDGQNVADGNGRVVLAFDTRPDDQLGRWSVVIAGLKSKRQLLVSFRLAR